MYIGEPFSREIIVVPIHEVSEADMKEIDEHLFQLTSVERLKDKLQLMYLSPDLYDVIRQIFNVNIADYVLFSEGNG